MKFLDSTWSHIVQINTTILWLDSTDSVFAAEMIRFIFPAAQTFSGFAPQMFSTAITNQAFEIFSIESFATRLELAEEDLFGIPIFGIYIVLSDRCE